MVYGNGGIGKRTYDDISSIIITFPSYGTETQSITAWTIHITKCNTIPAHDGYAVILVVDCVTCDGCVVGSNKIETNGVVSGRETTVTVIGSVYGGIIEEHVLHSEVDAAGDAEEMGGPVLDVKVLDNGASSYLGYYNEVVWPKDSDRKTNWKKKFVKPIKVK